MMFEVYDLYFEELLKHCQFMWVWDESEQYIIRKFRQMSYKIVGSVGIFEDYVST